MHAVAYDFLIWSLVSMIQLGCSRANSPRNGRANGDRTGFGELGPGNGADR